MPGLSCRESAAVRARSPARRRRRARSARRGRSARRRSTPSSARPAARCRSAVARIAWRAVLAGTRRAPARCGRGLLRLGVATRITMMKAASAATNAAAAHWDVLRNQLPVCHVVAMPSSHRVLRVAWISFRYECVPAGICLVTSRSSVARLSPRIISTVGHGAGGGRVLRHGPAPRADATRGAV